MPGDHPSRPQRPSQAELPAVAYQILYEFELRLSEKLSDIRKDTKEDIKVAIDTALVPVLARLDAGNKRFEEQDARASEHSEKINNALELAKASRERQEKLRKKKAEEEGTDEFSPPKKSVPWWLVLLIGGSLAFVGERAAKVVINSLADPPPAPTVQLPPPPVPTAQGAIP